MILRTVAAIALIVGALAVRAQPSNTVNPFTGLPDPQGNPSADAPAHPAAQPAPRKPRQEALASAAAALPTAADARAHAVTPRPRPASRQRAMPALPPVPAAPAMNLVSVVRTGGRAAALFAVDGGLARVAAASDDEPTRLAVMDIREVVFDGLRYRLSAERLTRFIAPDAHIASPVRCLPMPTCGAR